VAGMVDPFPLVGGKGLQRLQENGVEVSRGEPFLEGLGLTRRTPPVQVVVGCEEERCRELNKPFVHRVLQKSTYGFMHLVYHDGAFGASAKADLLVAHGQSLYQQCDAVVAEGAHGLQILEEHASLPDTVVRVLMAESIKGVPPESPIWEGSPASSRLIITRSVVGWTAGLTLRAG
jgi:diaminohydroxyphosphoribosylaminopyrimidine deaminase / 5-amino-6-(5-phosphoribosylamino)uracil reductase